MSDEEPDAVRAPQKWREWAINEIARLEARELSATILLDDGIKLVEKLEAENTRLRLALEGIRLTGPMWDEMECTRLAKEALEELQADINTKAAEKCL